MPIPSPAPVDGAFRRRSPAGAEVVARLELLGESLGRPLGLPRLSRRTPGGLRRISVHNILHSNPLARHSVRIPARLEGVFRKTTPAGGAGSGSCGRDVVIPHSGAPIDAPAITSRTWETTPVRLSGQPESARVRSGCEKCRGGAPKGVRPTSLGARRRVMVPPTCRVMARYGAAIRTSACRRSAPSRGDMMECIKPRRRKSRAASSAFAV